MFPYNHYCAQNLILRLSRPIKLFTFAISLPIFFFHCSIPKENANPLSSPPGSNVENEAAFHSYFQFCSLEAGFIDIPATSVTKQVDELNFGSLTTPIHRHLRRMKQL